MSEWQVIITPEFKNEIRDIHSYIANTLLSPETALKQVRRIMSAAETLRDMPLRNALYEKKPWRDRGLRVLLVDDFTVFYLPQEKTKEVIILHVFYSGRNIEQLLID